ncbi:sodium:solute symporter family transporter [Granulicella arctica]|uniref:Na+/proline symporter n=1 Tax=Granulicella arctica TaxID=940613 RepID=A0A7Y9PDJ3_9BACT|nr:hypothetical protein [Granulicella arctica]NYF77822.1 Na+/proline symporter [Granulicella arctica]
MQLAVCTHLEAPQRDRKTYKDPCVVEQASAWKHLYEQSVPDERSGRKAAYLSALLNFVGTPIMLLPALVARKLMPDFAAHQKPQDVYVHLIFGLLPAGMVGIIVAALFSATMATVSADLNAIAAVLTKDFYQRIIKPAASEQRLVAVGRGMTLALGACIAGISIWLGQSARSSLFNIMVTAFGVLLAPPLLPLLATSVVYSSGWRTAGIFGDAGDSSSSSMGRSDHARNLWSSMEPLKRSFPI